MNILVLFSCFLTLLVISNSVFAYSYKVCINSDILQVKTEKNTTTDGTPPTEESVVTTENKLCPNGCSNGQCLPIKSTMPVAVYITFVVITIIIIILSFVRDDILIVTWIGVILCFMLGINSMNVSDISCEYTDTHDWECYNHRYILNYVGWFWYGLGLVMVIYGFFKSIEAPAKLMTDAEKRL